MKHASAAGEVYYLRPGVGIAVALACVGGKSQSRRRRQLQRKVEETRTHQFCKWIREPGILVSVMNREKERQLVMSELKTKKVGWRKRRRLVMNGW
jgi:hypothetical protein